jgi:hypothetical protein
MSHLGLIRIARCRIFIFSRYRTAKWLFLRTRILSKHRISRITTAKTGQRELDFPDMPSSEASRHNLEKVKGRPSCSESQITKQLIWQWATESRGKRQPRTQCEWARVLGVCQQYISKIERCWAKQGFDLMLQPEGIA